jgi:type II secretory pathway predicted ATPase ExeA
LSREFRNAGYFETEQAQRIALALKPAIETAHLIALTGITGCGKTTTARRIRQDLDKERNPETHIWRQIDWSLYDRLIKDEKK